MNTNTARAIRRNWRAIAGAVIGAAIVANVAGLVSSLAAHGLI